MSDNPSKLLLGTSWCYLCAGLVACYTGNYDIAHVPLGIWVTSLIYWSDPTNKWKRMIDMAYVQYCIWYQYYWSFHTKYVYTYILFKTLGLAMYPISVYYYRHGEFVTSSYFHAGLHILSTGASIWMYMGERQPPKLFA